VSIVQHREDPQLLILRGRFKGDVQRFLGRHVEEIETPNADYRFRAYVPRVDVASALGRTAGTIRYPNFKDSIATRWRKTLAMRVWSMFHAAQDQRARLGRAADREGAQP
jgi:hypothetical protein